MKAKKTKSRRPLSFRRSGLEEPQADLFRKLFLGLSAVVLLYLVFTALQSGVNADDRFQISYSEKLVNYYASFGQDTFIEEMQEEGGNLYLYGGLFELLAGSVNRILGFEEGQYAYHQVRHLFVSLFGFGLILFCGLIGREIGGWRMGLVALLLAFLSPRLTGHALFNPKDIPFAFGYAMSIFFMLRFLRSMPEVKRTDYLWLGLGIGAALGIRVGALLLVAYWGLFLGLHYLLAAQREGLVDVKQLKNYLLYFVGPVGIGLLVGLIFWPFGLANPLANISKALSEFSDFQTGIKVLFDGEMVWSYDIPLEYLLTWIYLATPVVGLLGWVLFLVFARGIFRRFHPGPVAITLFAFIFPIVYVLANNSPLYDGVRHFLFALSMGVLVGATGWAYLIFEKFEKTMLRRVGFGILALLLLEPLVFMASNPATSYVFFNATAGGLKGALGEYELDYWGVSTKKAVDWMEKEGIVGKNMSDTLVVASNFPLGVRAVLPTGADKVKITYVRYRQRYDEAWDYGVFVSRFMDAAYLEAGTWPTSEAIHSVKVRGVPLAAVYKASSPAVAQGVAAAKSNNSGEAVRLLEQEVQQHPDNEVAWEQLSIAYLNTKQMDKAKNALDRALALNPESLTALNGMGSYYIQQNNLNAARDAFEKAAQSNDKNAVAFYYLALIYQQNNQLNKALENGEKAIQANPGFRGAYELVAQIFQQLGDEASAQRYRQAAQQLN